VINHQIATKNDNYGIILKYIYLKKYTLSCEKRFAFYNIKIILKLLDKFDKTLYYKNIVIEPVKLNVFKGYFQKSSKINDV
jgi:hypothetical protein